MPSVLTAYSVKIASSGDAGMEFALARETMADWNARHALKDKHILLPLEEDAAPEVSPGDLLVECFCSNRSRQEPSFGRGTEAEIEQYLQAGRPTLIYVSGGRSGLGPADFPQERELAQLRQRYASRARIDSYGDEKEFRAKFARDLEDLLGHHAYFRDETVPAVVPEIVEPVHELSSHARLLLMEACEDFEGYLGRIKTGTTLKIQANGKQLVEQGSAEAIVLWEGAFEEILGGGYIRDVGCHGQLFQISTKGFDYLKGIGKTPVGYISEMGNM